MEPQRRLLLSLGAVEHASHFGWEMTARKTLDVYDWALERVVNNGKYNLYKN
jgi:D-inositol-3-phosphate glycosyltransferase